MLSMPGKHVAYTLAYDRQSSADSSFLAALLGNQVFVIGSTLRGLALGASTPVPEGVDLAAVGVALPRIERLHCALSHEALDGGLCMPHLRELSLAQSRDLASLGGLDGCPRLKSLDVSHCRQLADFGAFAGLVHLEVLLASNTLLASLDPLLSCGRLRALDLTGCRLLTNLDNIGALELLETITISRTAVTSLLPLKQCLALTSVTARLCMLSSLAGIGGQPALVRLDLAVTTVHNPLLDCDRLPALQSLILASCKIPDGTPNPLLGAGLNLRELDLSRALSVTSVGAIAAYCPHLTTLLLNHCKALATLDGAEQLALLEVLEVEGTLVVSLTALSSNRCLRRLNIRATAVTSLDGLQHAAGLADLNASHTKIESLAPLRHCALNHLDVTACAALSTLDGLAENTTLVSLDASYTAIDSLEALQSARSLATLTVRACKHLSSLRGLEGASHLTTLNLNDTAIDTLAPIQHCASLTSLCVQWCTRLTTLAGLGPGLTRLQSLSLFQSGIHDAAAVAAAHPHIKMDVGFGANGGFSGFGAPPSGDGFGAPPSDGGFGAPPSSGGFGAPPSSGGFDAPPSSGGSDKRV